MIGSRESHYVEYGTLLLDCNIGPHVFITSIWSTKLNTNIRYTPSGGSTVSLTGSQVQAVLHLTCHVAITHLTTSPRPSRRAAAVSGAGTPSDVPLRPIAPGGMFPFRRGHAGQRETGHHHASSPARPPPGAGPDSGPGSAGVSREDRAG